MDATYYMTNSYTKNVSSIYSSKSILKKVTSGGTIGSNWKTPEGGVRGGLRFEGKGLSLTTRESKANKGGEALERGVVVETGNSDRVADKNEMTVRSINPFSLALSQFSMDDTHQVGYLPSSLIKEKRGTEVHLLEDKRMKIVEAGKNSPARLKIMANNKKFPMKFKTLDQESKISVYVDFNRIPTLNNYHSLYFNVRSFIISNPDNERIIRYVGILVEVNNVWRHFVGCSFISDRSLDRIKPKEDGVGKERNKEADGSKASNSPSKKNKNVKNIKINPNLSKKHFESHELTSEKYEEYMYIPLSYPDSN